MLHPINIIRNHFLSEIADQTENHICQILLKRLELMVFYQSLSVASCLLCVAWALHNVEITFPKLLLSFTTF